MDCRFGSNPVGHRTDKFREVKSASLQRLIANAGAFLGTNQTGEQISFGLPVTRTQMITGPPGQGPSQFTVLTFSTSQR